MTAPRIGALSLTSTAATPCVLAGNDASLVFYGGVITVEGVPSGIECQNFCVYGGSIEVNSSGHNALDSAGGSLTSFGGTFIAKAPTGKQAISGAIVSGDDVEMRVYKSDNFGADWTDATLDERNVCEDNHVKVAAKPPMVGDGTALSPYEIGTALQLKRFRDMVNGINGETKNLGAFAILTADIDVSGENRIPIGNVDDKYAGTFNGDGHTVTITVDYTAQGAGLFGYTGETSIVKNVTVEGSVTSNELYVGGVIGCSYGRISNCVNKAAVLGQSNVGGIVGKLVGNAAGMDKCRNLGSVSGTEKFVGGIVGYAYNGVTEDCYNLGAVQGFGNLGGIADNELRHPLRRRQRGRR